MVRLVVPSSCASSFQLTDLLLLIFPEARRQMGAGCMGRCFFDPSHENGESRQDCFLGGLPKRFLPLGAASLRLTVAPRDGSVRVTKSFADKDTAKVFRGEFCRTLAHDMQKTALKRLFQLDAATTLTDLAAFPGLRLEALRGDRKGQHSVRINQQWRVCFVWGEDQHAYHVGIADYH